MAVFLRTKCTEFACFMYLIRRKRSDQRFVEVYSYDDYDYENMIPLVFQLQISNEYKMQMHSCLRKKRLM